MIIVIVQLIVGTQVIMEFSMSTDRQLTLIKQILTLSCQVTQMVNDFDPELLDTKPLLYFHLQQQKLIELIRSSMSSSG